MGEWGLLLVRKDINVLISQVPMKIAAGADSGPFPGSFTLQVGYIFVSKKEKTGMKPQRKAVAHISIVFASHNSHIFSVK